MFYGKFKHAIDDKGRLSIPSRLRQLCGEKVYVTKGNDGCLAVYTEEGWNEYYSKLQALPQNKKAVRFYIRMITSHVCDCTFDKLGRINIPQTLREEGQIDKECMVIGSGDHIEIWDIDNWNAFYESNKASFDDFAEDLDGLI